VAPTKAQLDSWITTYNLICSAFIDAPNKFPQTINFFQVRETMLIVKLPEMKIVEVIKGDVTGLTASSVVKATTDILNFLKQP